MSRCAEDGVFNRVLCVTLLATAVTFTIILTNVFVDIDGLLTNKTRETSTATEQEESLGVTVTLVEVEGNPGDVIFEPDRLEMYGTEDTRNDLVDGETSRTRRSLDTPRTFKNNPKLRKLLTRRLETLLGELDSDAASTTQVSTTAAATVAATEDQMNDLINGIDTGERDEDELLKLAMNNILLDGVINHMELSTIYAEVHNLVQCFRQIGRKKAEALTYKNRKRGYFEEYDPIQEMAKCEDIRFHDNGISAPRKERKKIFIKFTVNIDTDDAENEMISENDVKGDLQIIFNGKPIKSTNEKEELSITTEPNEANSTINGRTSIRNKNKINDSSNFLQSFMRHYLKKYSKREISMKPMLPENNSGYKSERMKRHIKLRFNDKKQEDTHNNSKMQKETQEDEVFVEIKTHFNNKGMKGAKKKKLIKALIKKIEKAIHADLDQSPQKKKSMIVKQWNIKKRTQDPLETIKSNTHAMSLDKIFRRGSVGQREIDPITKEIFRNGPIVSDSNGNPWKRENDGPGFLAASKSINSAETGSVDVDYNKVLSVNGIPKRLQKPLTTDEDDLYEDLSGPDTYYVEHGIQNYKFLVKNIDGTGFSIGLNSYIDGLPEPEAIQMFSSLENLANAFQNTYKQTKNRNNIANNNVNSEATTHMLTKRETNAIKSHEDGLLNYYGQDIYKNRALRYHNYQEILDQRFKESKERTTPYSSRSNSSLNRKLRKRVNKPIQLPTLLDEQILSQELTPSDILGIANLFNRKKRHMELNTALNRKLKKNKLHKYFKKIPLKRLIYKKKRNKRQIRFIARRKEKDIFESSEKNTYADRAFINGVKNDVLDTDIMKAEDNYFKMAESPRVYNRQRNPGFIIRAHPSALSSLYPHIFFSEKVKYDDEKPERRDLTDNQPELRTIDNNEEVNESENNGNVRNKPVNKDAKLQDFEELVQSIIPPSAGRKFKVMVKIKPKSTTNGTEVTGFKEVHTSINKTFNQDGLQYYTLVNVSQISKIEKLNTTDTVTNTITTNNNTSPQLDKEHDTMKSLLQYQKDAINTQLRNLQKENSRIDSIIEKNLKTRRALYERFQFPPANVITTTEDNRETTTIKPTETPKSHLSADEISNIVMATINKFQQRQKPQVRRKAKTPVTVQTTTTTPTTSKPDVIAKILLTNINLTTQVLKKIDKNTELLTKFLSKLHTKKGSYIDKEYPTRRAGNMQHTKTCTHPDQDGICRNNNLDQIIDKRSIVSSDKPTVNAVLNPIDSVAKMFSRGDQKEAIQRSGTESNSRLNKFFMDDNKPRLGEPPGIFYRVKIMSTEHSENRNVTNPLFQ